MKRAEFLKTVRKEIHYIFARNEIQKELEQHLNESIEDLLAEGLSFDEAEAQAVLQMGDAKEIGCELNKEHNPLLGYLIMLTRCVLILMILPIFNSLQTAAHGASYMLFPVERTEYEQKQELNVTVETPIYYVKFDDLYLLENGDYSITYRAYLKFWKSRAINSFSCKFADQGGNEIMTAGYMGMSGILITQHDTTFMEDMDSVFIHMGDGQVLEVPLMEGSYEAE